MKLLVGNLLFTLVVPGTVAVIVPLALSEPTHASAGRTAAAIALFLLGGGTYAWTVTEFALRGKGTPAPIAPPRRLVVTGPHRLVRNPMYLGVLTVVLAWAVLRGSLVLLLYAMALAALFHAFVRWVEEPMLRRQFGDEYLRYTRAVRRWLPGRPFTG